MYAEQEDPMLSAAGTNYTILGLTGPGKGGKEARIFPEVTVPDLQSRLTEEPTGQSPSVLRALGRGVTATVGGRGYAKPDSSESERQVNLLKKARLRGTQNQPWNYSRSQWTSRFDY